MFSPMFVNCSLETPLYRSQRANVFSNVDKLSLFGFHLKITGRLNQTENLISVADLREPEKVCIEATKGCLSVAA